MYDSKAGSVIFGFDNGKVRTSSWSNVASSAT